VAGDVPPLNVEILVQLSNLTAAVQEATAGLNKIGDSAKGQESKFSSLKTTMLGVFSGNLMTEGMNALTGALHAGIKAVEDTQVATESLSTTLNNAKQNTAANRAEIQATTEKMSSLGFSTSASENAYNKLVSATGSVTESTKLMSMAADLARYKHEDLATAAATLEKGTMGSAKAFKEFGITLDTTLPKNQAIAKAMDELNQKIGGQAVGYTKTFAGQVEVLKSKFDDIAVKIGSFLMPILTKLMEILQNVLIPVAKFIYEKIIYAWIFELIKLWNTHEGLRKAVVEVIEAIVEALGYIVGAIAKVIDAASHLPIIGSHFKSVGQGIDEAAKKIGDFSKSIDDLANKKIGITAASLSDQLATTGTSGDGSYAGVDGNLGAAGNVSKAQVAAAKAATAAVAKRNAEITKYDNQLTTIQDQIAAVMVDRQNKMDAAVAARNDAEAKALDTFNQAKADIQQKYNDAVQAAQDTYNQTVENLETTHQQNLLDIQQQYANKAAQLEQAAADQRQSIIQQSIDLMTSAFASATKIDIGKLFTAGGSSAGGLVSQLQDQMTQITALQKDAGQLAAAGFNQSFIDEVISQGPAQGDALAQSVLTATPATQDSIKQLYAQIQDTSQNGLNDLAKQMNDGTNFATQALAQQYAQVGVTLTQQLAANSTAMQDAISKENDSFNKAMDTAQQTLDKAIAAAQDARNTALAQAQDTYNKAVQAAEDTFLKSSQAISDATMKQLDALQQKAEAVEAALAALGVVGAGVGGGGSSGFASGVGGTSTGALSNSNLFSSTPSGYVQNQTNVGNSNSTLGINYNQPPIIGTLTQNVYTTDPSLPSVASATINAITLGQTQGVIPATTVAVGGF